MPMLAVIESCRPSISKGTRRLWIIRWYRDVLQYMIDNRWNEWFTYVISGGEFLIGLGLVIGAFTGIAAFFGTLLNFNFLLAGTVSTNPLLFAIGTLLVLAWKNAGYVGLDRWLLPALGSPWQPGRIFRRPVESDTNGIRPRPVGGPQTPHGLAGPER